MSGSVQNGADASRPDVCGPDTLEPPFPLFVTTHVTSGFGRGSTELGFPTANIPPGLLSELEPGVYYGWAAVAPAATEEDKERVAQLEKEQKEQAEHTDHRPEFNYGSDLGEHGKKVLPMVMSIGWNPFYANKHKSAEVHIIYQFPCKFYGARAQVAVLGYIREEKSYDSLDALKEDIRFDIRVALNSLKRPAYVQAAKKMSPGTPIELGSETL